MNRWVLLLFIFMYVSTGCKDPVNNNHVYIKVINNSNKELLSINTKYTKYDFYDNLSHYCNYYLHFDEYREDYPNMPIEELLERAYLAPCSEKEEGIRCCHGGYEWLLKEYGKTSLLFIDCAKIPYVDLDKGAELKSICVRYDVSLDDLEELGWTVTFPPSEDMRRITMDPDFDTIVEWSKN